MMSTDSLTGNALVWAAATADGWQQTNSEALCRIRVIAGEEHEETLMPGGTYTVSLATLKAKHGEFVDIPMDWR